MLLQGQSKKRNTVSFSSPRRYSHEGALSMGMPDAEVASSLRSGVDLLKQSLDNGDSSNGDSYHTGLTPQPPCSLLCRPPASICHILGTQSLWPLLLCSAGVLALPTAAV